MNVTPDHASAQGHGTACGCGKTHGQKRTAAHGALRWFSAIAPVIACAFCPVCLATYAKLFSLAGLGFAMTEAQHSVLLTSALCVSIAASVWRGRRSGRWSPLAGALAGGSILLVGHLAGERAWLEWSGIGVMLASAWHEQRIASRPSPQRRAVLQPGSAAPAGPRPAGQPVFSREDP